MLYYAFLQVGEMTVLLDVAFNPQDHLCVTKIVVNNKKTPTESVNKAVKN